MPNSEAKKKAAIREALDTIRVSAEFGLEKPTVKNMRIWLEDILMTARVYINRIEGKDKHWNKVKM